MGRLLRYMLTCRGQPCFSCSECSHASTRTGPLTPATVQATRPCQPSSRWRHSTSRPGQMPGASGGSQTQQCRPCPSQAKRWAPEPGSAAGDDDGTGDCSVDGAMPDRAARSARESLNRPPHASCHPAIVAHHRTGVRSPVNARRSPRVTRQSRPSRSPTGQCQRGKQGAAPAVVRGPWTASRRDHSDRNRNDLRLTPGERGRARSGAHAPWAHRASEPAPCCCAADLVRLI